MLAPYGPNGIVFSRPIECNKFKRKELLMKNHQRKQPVDNASLDNASLSVKPHVTNYPKQEARILEAKPLDSRTLEAEHLEQPKGTNIIPDHVIIKEK